jgi:hypothetical protein
MVNETQPQTAKTLHRKASFGLRTALVAMVAIATLLASYRVGYERGRKLGPMVPANISAFKICAREYEVSDIVKSEADAELLINSLRELVEPDSWDVVGKYAEISYSSKSGAFAVSHVWSGHVSVVKYLSTVRELAAGRADLAVVVQDVKSHW